MITFKPAAFATALLAAVSLPALARAETATIALAVNINTLDPHMSGSFASDLSLLSHVYPALILRGPDLKLQPALAKSWTPVNDTTWRFELVPGAKFAMASRWMPRRCSGTWTGARSQGECAHQVLVRSGQGGAGHQ